MLRSIVFIPLFFIANAYAQNNWQKQKVEKKPDSIYAIYSWAERMGQHGASGKLILSKSGRFTYSSSWPLANENFSEGTYSINKDTIILNSYVQPENIEIRIEYIDSLNIDKSYNRLPLPIDLKGKSVYAYYLINNDSTDNGIFVPDDIINPNFRNLIDSIYSLKVQINTTHFGSKWVTIPKNNKFIRVVVLTEKDFYYYRPEVITNYKILIKGNKLIDISNSKIGL
jgi:hypothetical protein